MRATSMTTVSCLFALSLMAAPAQAQTVSFAELSAKLDVGVEVTVESAGGAVAGRLAALDPSGLVLTADSGGSVAVGAAEVRRVRVHDPAANGVVAGALVGAVPGALVGSWAYRYCQNESSSPSCWQAPVIITAVAAGLGAVLGLAIDDAVHRVWHVQPKAAPAVRALPWATRAGGGVAIAIAF